jgi:uncharacterized protein YjaG (DUF416 family)
VCGCDRGERGHSDEPDDRRLAEVTSMQKFDEAKLISEIGVLPPPLRVAFAAACAERQMSAYREFEKHCGRSSPNALDLALEEVWAHPEQPQDIETFEEQIEAMMSLVPQEDSINGPWTQDATNAQNAGMAVIYALRTKLRADPQEAAWAARVAYEALDNFVINGQDVDTNMPGAELRVLAHTLVQAELARQLSDIEDLKLHASEPVPTAIARVRTRATADANRFFRS